MWGGIWKSCLVVAVAMLAIGCPPDDDDDSAGTGPTFAGTLVDADRNDQLLEGCLVGETVADAVESGADGTFSLELSEAGATVHVDCDGGVLRSFRLPDAPTAFDWEIPVDMGTGPDLGVQCVPNISGDAEPVGLAAGEGRMELRVLTETATGSWDTTLPSAGWTVQVTGFLRVTQGPYLVIAKAHSGSIPGFAVSETLTCDGNGSSPTTELELAAVQTTSLTGSWSPASGSNYFFAASSPLAGVGDEFLWYEYDIVHTSSASSSTFELELLDGVGVGDPTVAACQQASDGRQTCLFQQGVTDGDDLGDMPEYVSLDASVNGSDIRITALGTITDGSVTVHLTDENQDRHWTGWAPGAGSEFEIDVPEEWLGNVPVPATLSARGSGERNVTSDLATGFESTGTPNGWSIFRTSEANF